MLRSLLKLWKNGNSSGNSVIVDLVRKPNAFVFLVAGEKKLIPYFIWICCTILLINAKFWLQDLFPTKNATLYGRIFWFFLGKYVWRKIISLQKGTYRPTIYIFPGNWITFESICSSLLKGQFCWRWIPTIYVFAFIISVIVWFLFRAWEIVLPYEKRQKPTV